MTKLSVNINKIALIRNARGSDYPHLLSIARDIQRFGADGITVHPRPDERHVKFTDCYDLKEVVYAEFNIEGYPNKRFMQMIKDVRPEQVTLVPDHPDALTSDNGWDTHIHNSLLQDIIAELHAYGARVSLFLNPDNAMVEGAKKCNADRIELYTGPYAHDYSVHAESAVQLYAQAASYAQSLDLAVNAGHDLNLSNLAYLKQHIPHLAEVSIGHALTVDALYYGLQNTIQMYKAKLV